ncbi:MAG: response regulator transcription factor [Saprospiraceae bacterium]|nr:response regulator transcription factor [Saprospiraceae bacterium]MBK8451414.1 response regulator transcription factor [Saprospiraceae bacterium]MBK8483377.1 response regulator transcription factor [Saprospiraceae bacterium]MBK9220888.1 response regulator transcription factor [Saprospiraceae bacterium]MBK9729288.1 response regulator transcription factor [Saprospiraceae bacterium]
MSRIRYVVADDHQLYVKGFILLLQRIKCRFPLECIGEASNGQELLRLISPEHVDLLFLDLNLAENDAALLIPKLKELHSDLKILCISMYTDDKVVREALRKGADGYLSKNTGLDELANAIDAVMEGEMVLGSNIKITNPDKKTMNANVNLTRFNAKYQLTKREREILEQIAKGKSNRDISALLFISKDTVSVHRKNLMRKLNVKNASGLIKVAYEYNLI